MQVNVIDKPGVTMQRERVRQADRIEEIFSAHILANIGDVAVMVIQGMRAVAWAQDATVNVAYINGHSALPEVENAMKSAAKIVHLQLD